MDTPEYDYEYKMGEETEWENLLPREDGVIALAENDTKVKIALIDELPSRTVHADKEALREKGPWGSADEFREDVDWGYYSDDD